MSQSLVIDIEHMDRIFQTDEIETHALSGVHLQVRRGEYVSISGPSGSCSASGTRGSVARTSNADSRIGATYSRCCATSARGPCKTGSKRRASSRIGAPA